MTQHRKPISEIPVVHHRFRGVFHGVTDSGHRFDLEVRDGRRRLNSSELVRAQIRSMSRGRVMTSTDMYADETAITLFPEGRRRIDIELLPNGSYRHGRDIDRTLRGLVETVLGREWPAAPRMP